MGKHQAIKNILLVFLSATFSLAIIEGFLAWRPELQARRPFENFVYCAGPPQEGQPHELFGWTAVPEGAYFVEKNEADGWVVYINNAHGFRDLYDSGNKNVIVLGDSFTAGSNANNDETFPHLLDVWNPDMSFRNFGVGGYGTSNALSVYEVVSSEIPHDLVILTYFLGNDLRDNLGRRNAMSVQKEGDSTWFEFLKEVNSDLRQFVRSYNLLYSAVRSEFGEPGLSPDQVAEGIERTDQILSAMIREIRSNEADLLVVPLPSWNQIHNYLDPEEDNQQRGLIQQYIDKFDNVYIIDITSEIERVGADEFYGIVDKHFRPLGYYLTAKLIHEWINLDWPRGRRAERDVPPFQPRAAPIDPDCAAIAEYREAFANPLAERRGEIAERGKPGGAR